MAETTKHKTVGREVRYEFSDHEKADLASKLTMALRHQADLEQRKSEAASSYTAQIKAAKAEVARIAGAHREGFEMRTVPCNVEFDYDERLVRYIRTDNGEEAGSRPMTEDERQIYFTQPCAECDEVFPVKDMVDVDGKLMCPECATTQAADQPTDEAPAGPTLNAANYPDEEVSKMNRDRLFALVTNEFGMEVKDGQNVERSELLAMARQFIANLPKAFSCCDCGQTKPMAEMACDTPDGPLCKACDKAMGGEDQDQAS